MSETTDPPDDADLPEPEKGPVEQVSDDLHLEDQAPPTQLLIGAVAAAR